MDPDPDSSASMISWFVVSGYRPPSVSWVHEVPRQDLTEGICLEKKPVFAITLELNLMFLEHVPG